MDIKTTLEVWRSIKSAHGDDLKVFSSYSAPDGDMYFNPNVCVMETEYGLKGADFPIIRAKTTWDRDMSGSFKRENEKHEYWLSINVNDD